MKRRGFLKFLGAGAVVTAAGLAFPERRYWQVGAQLSARPMGRGWRPEFVKGQWRLIDPLGKPHSLWDVAPNGHTAMVVKDVPGAVIIKREHHRVTVVNQEAPLENMRERLAMLSLNSDHGHTFNSGTAYALADRWRK